jgi:hypothetical protein
MKQRYGRSRRIAYLDRIKELEKIAQQDTIIKKQFEMANDDLRKKLRKANETIDDMVNTIQRVCSYSVALPPRTVHVSKEQLDRVKNCGSHILCDSVDYITYATAGSIAPDSLTQRVIYMNELRFFIQQHRERFEMAVHATYACDRESVYMLSARALQSMTGSALMARYMEDVGWGLVQAIQEYTGSKQY